MSQAYKLTKGNPITLPQISRSLMNALTKEDLMVLLELANAHYECSVNDLSDKTGLSLLQVAKSIDLFLQKNLISEIQKPTLSSIDPTSLPKGSSSYDAKVISTKDLSDCIATCQEIMGKQLNSASISSLVAIIQDLNVSEYYLVTLLSYCVNKRQANGIHYLETTAIELCNQGIRSDEALNEYLSEREKVHEHELDIRRLYGFGKRALTNKELAILTEWFSTYGFSMDIINMAYDQTCASAKNVTLTYTDKILKTWYQNGLKTKEDIQNYIQEVKTAKQNSKKKIPKKTDDSSSSFDLNQFIDAAIKRSYGDEKED